MSGEKIMRRIMGWAVLLLTLLATPIPASAEDDVKIVRAKASVDKPAVSARQSFTIDLMVRVRSAWHINSDEPGIELMIPTTVRMEDQDLVETVEVVYPKPKKRRFPYHKKSIPVFEDRFTITLKMKMKPSAAAGPHTLKGLLRFQACSSSSGMPPEEVPLTVDIRYTP